jgi:tetratricopeptide (TPR) repeat protein
MDALRAAVLALLLAGFALAQPDVCSALNFRSSGSSEPQFFDEPQFVVAGVTDDTYRGGHGSGTLLRSTEALAKATASLSGPMANADGEDSHHALAEAEERSGDPLQAVREFQRAAESNPNERNLFDWGLELMSHRAPQPAAEVFSNGIRRFPQSVRMLLGLASARYSAGQYEGAAQCFFKAADLAPSDPNPYLLLGKVQSREITESAGYQERMARFARLQPENAFANYYYAVTIWNRSSGPERSESLTNVRDLLQKAIVLDAHLGLAYLQLGIVYADQREYSNAIHAYLQAINVSPDLEEAHYRLSEAYRLTGDSARAAQELALFNQLSKHSAEKLERERRGLQQFVITLRNPSSSQPTPHQ